MLFASVRVFCHSHSPWCRLYHVGGGHKKFLSSHGAREKKIEKNCMIVKQNPGRAFKFEKLLDAKPGPIEVALMLQLP